ncbi:MAG TPA: hypothetical protein VMX36_00585 [Sedimentisphaerales bacterium]|nr:hypothetical protein [Sedimentisphaerales bacterium]
MTDNTVISAKAEIQKSAILSEAKDLALGNRNCVVAKKMNGIPSDTTLEAARKEFEILRRLGPHVRARMEFEMSDNLRRIVEAGVRHRHPDFDEKKIRLEVLRLMIRDKLYRQMLKGTETRS